MYFKQMEGGDSKMKGIDIKKKKLKELLNL